MSKDKYSDNHTIVVDGGSGTLNVNGNLNVSGSISSSGGSGGGLELSGYDLNLAADRNISITGGSTVQNSGVVISAGAGFTDKGSQIELSSQFNSVVVKAGVTTSVSIPTDGISIVAKDDINIYGGAGSVNGVVTLSANNGSSPKLELTESTNTAKITATNFDVLSTIGSISTSSNSFTVTSATVNVNGVTSITLSAPTVTVTQNARTKTASIPGASFQILEKYDGSGDSSSNAVLGTGDEFRHTENGNVYWTMDTVGSGDIYGHIFAPLPEYIPDGSIITHLGASLDLSRDDVSDGQTLTTTVMLRRYTISSGVGSTVATEQIITNLDGHQSFLSECSSVTIDRENYTYTILVQFKMQQGGSRKHAYLTSGRLRYTTTKLDPNL